MKASDIQLSNNISLLFKGPWGHGKTLAAASFALEGPVYLSYWDKKSPIELKNYFSMFGAKGKKILDNIEFDVFGASNAGEYLEKMIKLAQDCRYVAVINDSVTNMTSGAVNWSIFLRDNKKIKDKIKQIIPDWDEYKVETSLCSQALDLCRTFPCYVIWMAHPVASTKIEGSGGSIKVSKVNRIVSYGSKVGDIVPGQFSEIYHFTKQSSWSESGSKTQYVCSFDAIGDDFAKSNIGLKGELDWTDGLFYELWKEKVAEHKEVLNENLKRGEEEAAITNPLANIEWK